jgi:hypothetical protein
MIRLSDTLYDEDKLEIGINVGLTEFKSSIIMYFLFTSGIMAMSALCNHLHGGYLVIKLGMN